MFLPDNKLRRLPPKLAAADFIAKEQPIRTFDTSTDGVLRLFTSHGACLTLRVEDIPETKPQAKPTNLSAVFELEQDEKLLAICDEDFSVGKVFFYTRGGLVKCTEASEYITKMKRIAAVNLKEGDGLVRVEYMRRNNGRQQHPACDGGRDEHSFCFRHSSRHRPRKCRCEMHKA